MEAFSKFKKTIHKSNKELQGFVQKQKTKVFGSKKRNNLHKSNSGQSEYDKQLVLSLSKSRIPNLRQFKYIKKFLSPKEIWILRISFLVLFSSIIYSASTFYVKHLNVVPIAGGVYREGLVGNPRLINPLYAQINDVDNDIVSLIFSSLFKRGKDGELKQDLVEKYNISEDGKEYSFTIKSEVFWHDDERKLNVDDIIFTFEAIKDKDYKSPLRSSFIGVEIEKVDDLNFKFVLSEPYAAFLDLLTFGIMPAELWSQVSLDEVQFTRLNIYPIGSGQYKVDEIEREDPGKIIAYHLVPNEKYYGTHPRINLNLKFYPNIEETIYALNENLIDGISMFPSERKSEIKLPNTFEIHKLRIPQITLLFLNSENNPALGDKAARQALAYSIDRNRIINKVLGGYGDIVNSPILPSSFAYNENVNRYEYDIIKAEKLLDSIDWKIETVSTEDVALAETNKEAEDESLKEAALGILKVGEGKWRKKDGKFLVIKITTVDRNENAEVINMISDYWKNIGVKAEIEVVSVAKIQSDIIKPRNFEAMYYGQILGADPDSYIFWHSSQIGEDGYNIAGYSNKEVDKLLEDGRLISDQGERQTKYRKFQEIISEEMPVIFMYSPNYLYPQNKKVNGFEVNSIITSPNRFSNIDEWYIEVGKKLVW